MRIQDAKSLSIIEYLERLGHKHVKTVKGKRGPEYVYHVPWRKDRTPSLFVNPQYNIWNDVSQKEGGGLIEMVCTQNFLPKTEVSGALKILDNIFPDYKKIAGTSGPQHELTRSAAPVFAAEKNSPTGLKEKEVPILKANKPLYRYALKNYLTEERKIPLALGEKYFREIEYERDGKNYYALGFPAGETFALRNKYFKGFLGEGPTISIFEKSSPELYLFEGVFDFLSYLTIKKRSELTETAIVLNSTAFSGHFKRYLSKNTHVLRVFCFLDNDFGGFGTLEDLRKSIPKVEFVDRSEQYGTFKDLNEWHCST